MHLFMFSGSEFQMLGHILADLICQKKKHGGVLCVMVTDVRNWHIDLSSNPGQNCLNFTYADTLGNGMITIIIPPTLRE